MSYNDLRTGRYSHADHYYFITTVTDKRRPLFTRFFLARQVIQQMRLLEQQGLVSSMAWVLMPDHLHWLLALQSGAKLSTVIAQFKGRSARALNLHMARTGRLWQPSFYDHALRHDEEIRPVADYIVANPLRARLVESIADYPHWDSVWL